MVAIIPKPPALTFHVVTPLYSNTCNPHSSFPPFLKFPHQRRRFRALSSSLVLPLLPFSIDQVLVPSEAKTLHLYEARYIALLEESLFQKSKLFVHFVLDPISFSGASSEASFAARYGCLVTIEKVERLEIGALVTIRGVGRVTILGIEQGFYMVRSKIKYELIADDRTRRETFKKRKTGIFKKLNELKTLCEVEACGIIINGDGCQSEVWPSPQEASPVIQKFVNLPSSSQANNMVDQAGFLRQNLSRLSRNLDKETRKVQSIERELLLSECLTKGEMDMSHSTELHEMLRLLERKIGMVDCRIAYIEPSSSNMVASARDINLEPHHAKGKQPL